MIKKTKTTISSLGVKGNFLSLIKSVYKKTKTKPWLTSYLVVKD